MTKKLDYRMLSFVILALICISLLSIFILRPVISGYGIYQEVQDSGMDVDEYLFDLSDLREKLTVSDTNLSSCIILNERLFADVDECNSLLKENIGKAASLHTSLDLTSASLNKDIERLNKELKESEDEVEECENNLNDISEEIEKEVEKEIDSLQDDYDALASSSAYNICCKEKVDDSTIDSYSVSNNRIICSDDGDIELIC